MERLQRILASRGVASRRAAEELIREGRVKVNGAVVTELGTKADPKSDEIRVDNQILRQQPLRYLILNKPTGYITTMNDERGRWTVMDLIRVPERVFPVGRLDRATEGLLIFTNDGDVANRIMHPRYGLAKEYHVLAKTRPTTAQTNRIRGGVVIDGKRIVPEEFRLLRETSEGFMLTITVHEGMYHLVRRIMEIAGIEVLRLRRARIGPISIQGLSLGEWRDLTTGEQNMLFEALHIDDETIARNAERPIKVRPTGAHGPANQLWTKPKRPEDKPAPKPNVPYYKKPSRTEREAAERAQTIADGPSRTENEQYDKPKRDQGKPKRTNRSDESQRDRDRRSSRKRKDDPRGSPR